MPLCLCCSLNSDLPGYRNQHRPLHVLSLSRDLSALPPLNRTKRNETTADWSDRNILWVRADFGVGGDGSVISTSWFSLGFKPSTLVASPDLKTIYAANKVSFTQ